MVNMVEFIPGNKKNLTNTTRKPKSITEDPRSDLSEDSEAWRKMLVAAKRESILMCGILHGIRCGGARIVRGDKGLRITGGDWDGYEKHKEYLMPYRDQITKMLRGVAR